MLPMIDLFDLFRWLLGTVVTVYATVLMVQWGWSWWHWLTRPGAGYERQFALLRRYLVLHGLRLRLARFGMDLLVIIGLGVVFVLLFQAHLILYATPRNDAPPIVEPAAKSAPAPTPENDRSPRVS